MVSILVKGSTMGVSKWFLITGSNLGTGIEGKRFLISNNTSLLIDGTGIFWILDIR
jgi:hypothetical protein